MMTRLSFKTTLALLDEELHFARGLLNTMNIRLPWNKDPGIEAKFIRATDRAWFMFHRLAPVMERDKKLNCWTVRTALQWMQLDRDGAYKHG